MNLLDDNRNRIWAKRVEAPGGAESLRFELPSWLQLTAGQTYWWGVEVVKDDGTKVRKAASFKVEAPVAAAGLFSSVTVITHGQNLPAIGPDPTANHLFELAKDIAKSNGGTIAKYDPVTGAFTSITGGGPITANGKALVLIADWSTGAAINDTGFAEAAGEALFAALLRLDRELVGAIFQSNMHVIGQDRGAVVNSEMLQRMTSMLNAPGGPARAGMPSLPPDLHVTTLNPSDGEKVMNLPVAETIKFVGEVAKGLSIAAVLVNPAVAAKLYNFADKLETVANVFTLIGYGQIDYGDLKDPDVKIWKGVTFADNYYTTVADATKLTFTMNGRSLAADGADIDRNLTGRAGFIEDDLYGAEYLGTRYGLGLNTVGNRLVAWYGGTADLQRRSFGADPDKSELIWRRLADRTYETPNGAEIFSSSTLSIAMRVSRYDPDATDGIFPVGWYLGFEDVEQAAAAFKNTLSRNGAIVETPSSRSFLPSMAFPTEGVGEGYYYSAQGGGIGRRPTINADKRVDPDSRDSDNTEVFQGGVPIPIIFNGTFQQTLRPLYGRFPLFVSGYQIPGWSLDGGSGTGFQGWALRPHYLDGAFTRFLRENFSIGDKIPSLPQIPPLPSGEQALVTASEWLKDLATNFLTPFIENGDKDDSRDIALFDNFLSVVNAVERLEFMATELKRIFSAALTDQKFQNGFKAFKEAVEGYAKLGNEHAEQVAKNTGGKFEPSPTSFKEILIGSLKDTLVGALDPLENADMFSAMAFWVFQYAIDWRVSLNAFNDHTITHNWAVFPATTSVLGVDVSGISGRPDVPQSGGRLEVFAEVANGNSTRIIFLQPVDPSVTTSLDDLQNRRILFDARQLQGQVGKLSVRFVPWQKLGEQFGSVQVDNITFDSGFTITDDEDSKAVSTTDGVIFLTEGSQPFSIGKVLPTDWTGYRDIGDGAGFGTIASEARTFEKDKTLQSFLLRNDTGTDRRLKITVSANDFLLLEGDSIANARFNADASRTFEITVAANSTYRLTAKAMPTLKVLDKIKAAGSEVLLLNADLTVEAVDGGESRTLKVFYLADVADDDATDGILRLADTRELSTRTVRIENAGGAEAAINPGFLDKDAGYFSTAETEDGNGINLVFAPGLISSNGGERQTRVLEFSYGGRVIGATFVQAFATPTQTLKLDFNELRTTLEVLRNRLEGGLYDSAGVAAGRYQAFFDIFGTNATFDDRTWNTFTGSIKRTLIDIFNSSLRSGALNLYEIDGDTALNYFATDAKRKESPVGVNEVLFQYQASTRLLGSYPLSEQSKSPGLFGTNPTDDYWQSYAYLDFDEDSVAGLTSDSTDFDGATLRTDLTQAAIDYRIAYGLNQARNGVKSLIVPLPHMVLVVDGAMRQLTTTDTVRTAGELFGWLYAHEFIHNLGLPDDFTGGPASLLSTRGNTSLRPDDLKLLAMALDDPTLTAEDRKGLQTRLARLAELARFDRAEADEPRASPGAEGPTQASVSPDASLITLGPAATEAVSSFAAAPAAFSAFVPLFDWSLTGSATVAGGSVTITEDPRLFSRAVRDFTVPADARILTFRITDLRLGANNGPQDAFEIALLGTDGASVAGAIALTATDAALNVQAGGGVVTSERTTIGGRTPGTLPTPAAPWTVSIDLSHLPAGTVVRLYLDLLGFGALGSSVAVTDFAFSGRSINTAPVARGDQADVVEGGTVTIDARANDSDADGDSLTLLLRDPPAHGTVSIAEGRFVYTPAAGYRGPDSFTYVVSDGTATSQPATVAITVLARQQNRPPVAFDDRASVPAGAVVDIAVLANDSDPDGDTLAARIVTGPVHGLATFLSDGRIRYLADAGYAGPDSIVYEVDDGAGGTARATVALTIESAPVDPANRAPVAAPDAIRVAAGDAVRIEVLTNDSDPDGDALAAVLVAGPANGSLTARADGSFVYAPNRGFSGIDRFVYVANDGRSSSARTEVTITVDRLFRAPVFLPVPDVVIAEGDTLAVDVKATDPDGDPVVYELLSAPAGAVIDRTTGRLTWGARDGDAIALFKVRASDSTGSATDLDVAVRVRDVAPTLDVAAPPSAVLGAPVTVVLSARDPGDDTIRAWAIDWGDGRSDIVSGATATVQHAYGAAGVFSIRVSAANEDGTFSAAPRDIRVVSPYLEVSTFTPLANGFHLRFNQPLITESLNLYGTAPGPMPPPTSWWSTARTTRSPALPSSMPMARGSPSSAAPPCRSARSSA